MVDSIRLGYACINTELRKQEIFTGRTLTIASLRKKGITEAKKLAMMNIMDLSKIIDWNEAHGFRFFRITSNLFPHMENSLVMDLLKDYNLNFAKTQLREIGKKAKKYGHRITSHPGQFAQLGSPNESVVAQTFKDLLLHANIFRAMGLQPSDGSVMIIHGGGRFGDATEALKRFEKNFKKLPLWVRKYISLENDEWNYSITDLLPLCERLKIPFTLDVFHNNISKDSVKLSDDLLKRIFATWKEHLRPKIHYSTQEPGERLGTHSKTIDKIPEEIFTWVKKFNLAGLDIMLESKLKEVNVINMYQKYFRVAYGNHMRIHYVLK
jgi:UV DNA damage endonuclease